MEENKVVSLHLDDIIPNRFQPREVFDERALKELAVSIKEHGVIQPIIVREIDGGKYEIIAGERRYKGAALAGLTTIPAIIRNLDDKEAAKVALLENLQRKNLNPIEEARTYKKILELDNMTQEELSKTMGKSQSAVANKLRLLSLPEEVQQAVLKEEISERHARALLNLSSSEEQIKMLHRIVKEKLTVRKVEEEIKNINMPKNDDKLKDNNDLESLINPKPVSLNNKPSGKDTSFLMSPSPAPSTNNNDNGIINYGEIKDDEDDPVNDMERTDLSSGEITTGPLDLEQLIKGTKDIGNINNMVNNEDKGESNAAALMGFGSPKDNSTDDLLGKNDVSLADKAIKESEDKNDSSKDYFSAPDLMNINMPASSSLNTNRTSLGSIYSGRLSTPKKDYDSLVDFSKQKKTEPKKEEKKEDLSELLLNKNENKENESLGSVLMKENKASEKDEYNIRGMVEKIRSVLKDLEHHGAKIDTDEMNFENEYQILIKIDKNIDK